ncbi:MAG: recombination regulator RecX [Lactobacillaceae bacterium]|jgi:regulatory protein|nr:recombination regulator RecX [Lactobacillaceae bacterium]
MAKTITRIYTQKRGGRYNLDLDGKFAFGISTTTFAKFLLFKGTELTDEQIENIKKFDRLSTLKNKALNFLSGQLRTEKEVVDKLKTVEEVSDDEIKSVIDDLKQDRYIDDLVYAESLVRTQMNIGHDGPQSIKQKLFKKGVPSSTIEKSLQLFDGDSQLEHAKSQAEKLVQINQGKLSTKGLQQKIYQQLQTKGFSTSIINGVLDDIEIEEDADEQIELIKKQIEKIAKRYEKYGNQKNYKMKSYLYGKGFPIEEINTAIEEYENEKG